MKTDMEMLCPDTRHQISVISNGIDLPSEATMNFKKWESEASKEKQILFVGRLVTEKGVDLLLQAAPVILKNTLILNRWL
ncbi:glycosyltransferase [Hazenella sp. IB182357]|uniref:Glycosyltransferase n=1 Tax=Polycladospora coralii TaxID=2771432 RepID=A0A926NEL6_9BACL|nr:glycosyltransferase [Polycladospora coralii]